MHIIGTHKTTEKTSELECSLASVSQLAYVSKRTESIVKIVSSSFKLIPK